ncbi:hypothetical protein EDB83DRAFT_984886 [Lactarius deliciosus]|nr:hypothetical protein EDB83DRAFT_984886 [Lactarius deliciosus]
MQPSKTHLTVFLVPSPFHAISSWTLRSVYAYRKAHVCTFLCKGPCSTHMHAPHPLYSTIHSSIHSSELTFHRSELMLFFLRCFSFFLSFFPKVAGFGTWYKFKLFIAHNSIISLFLPGLHPPFLQALGLFSFVLRSFFFFSF